MQNEEGIIEAIRSCRAGDEAKDFCIRLMHDAIARRVMGEFNLYGALSGSGPDGPWERLYHNPTNDKHAFLPVIQILSAVTGARLSAIVSEGWHLDVRSKSEQEIAEMQAVFDRDGFSISGHPESRECIFVTVETDDEALVATVSLPIEEGKTIMVESSRDNGLGMEGMMTGMRPPSALRVKAMHSNLAETRAMAAELEMDWIRPN